MIYIYNTSPSKEEYKYIKCSVRDSWLLEIPKKIYHILFDRYYHMQQKEL